MPMGTAMSRHVRYLASYAPTRTLEEELGDRPHETLKNQGFAGSVPAAEVFLAGRTGKAGESDCVRKHRERSAGRRERKCRSRAKRNRAQGATRTPIYLCCEFTIPLHKIGQILQPSS